MMKNIIIKEIDNVIYVGKEQYPEVETSFHHYLDHQELIFHFSGLSTVLFNGKILENAPGTLRYLPQGPNYQYVVKRTDPGDCIDIFFSSDLPLAKEAFVKNLSENNQLSGLFRKLFHTWIRKDEGYYYECLSLLYRILAELEKENYIPEKQYLTLKPALDYIDSHFLDEKISIELLSDLCGISTSYLKKLFLKKFGLPPVKYIIQLKINYACDLLRSGRYDISQTAAMCGYRDIYYFSRQFKEYAGVSPSSFRENQYIHPAETLGTRYE